MTVRQRPTTCPDTRRRSSAAAVRVSSAQNRRRTSQFGNSRCSQSAPPPDGAHYVIAIEVPLTLTAILLIARFHIGLAGTGQLMWSPVDDPLL